MHIHVCLAFADLFVGESNMCISLCSVASVFWLLKLQFKVQSLIHRSKRGLCNFVSQGLALQRRAEICYVLCTINKLKVQKVDFCHLSIPMNEC